MRQECLVRATGRAGEVRLVAVHLVEDEPRHAVAVLEAGAGVDPVGAIGHHVRPGVYRAVGLVPVTSSMNWMPRRDCSGRFTGGWRHCTVVSGPWTGSVLASL